jgi:hypothetical protein
MDRLKRLAFPSALLATSFPAFAAAPAVTDTVTEIATYAAPIAAIGLAVLAVVLAVKGVKWFRRAL